MTNPFRHDKRKHRTPLEYARIFAEPGLIPPQMATSLFRASWPL